MPPREHKESLTPILDTPPKEVISERPGGGITITDTETGISFTFLRDAQGRLRCSARSHEEPDTQLPPDRYKQILKIAASNLPAPIQGGQKKEPHPTDTGEGYRRNKEKIAKLVEGLKKTGRTTH